MEYLNYIDYNLNVLDFTVNMVQGCIFLAIKAALILIKVFFKFVLKRLTLMISILSLLSLVSIFLMLV